MADKPEPSYAPPYVALYPMLATVARRMGYALGVHGSLTRDFDLIAVPWVEHAGTPDDLIAEFVRATGGGTARPLYEHIEDNPSRKPHGRLGYAIHLGGAYLDVSVMPRLKKDDK